MLATRLPPHKHFNVHTNPWHSVQLINKWLWINACTATSSGLNCKKEEWRDVSWYQHCNRFTHFEFHVVSDKLTVSTTLKCKKKNLNLYFVLFQIKRAWSHSAWPGSTDLCCYGLSVSRFKGELSVCNNIANNSVILKEKYNQ